MEMWRVQRLCQLRVLGLSTASSHQRMSLDFIIELLRVLLSLAHMDLLLVDTYLRPVWQSCAGHRPRARVHHVGVNKLLSHVSIIGCAFLCAYDVL